MNAFENNLLTEESAQKVLVPWLRSKWELVVLNTEGSRTHLETQKRNGDAFVSRGGKTYWLEIKSEKENAHGNLFIEVWSNKSRFTKGWIYETRADRLLYYFIGSDELFVCDMADLQRWCFDVNMGRHNIERHPLREQTRHGQMNDTWGHCVPIETLAVSVKGWKTFHPKWEMENGTN